jgi:hypothetical protein
VVPEAMGMDVDVIMKHGGIAETNADNHVTVTHVSK